MMRQFIISFILFVCWIADTAAAKEFSYGLNISNRHAVVKEAVILTLELNQTKAGKVMRFSFKPPKSDHYQTEFLEAQESKDDQNRIHTVIKYAIFPLHPGHLEIPLSVTLQQASSEELKKFVTGSADELIYLQTTNRTAQLPSVVLDVAPLPKGVKIVGDYHLDFEIDSNRTVANQQIDVAYTLKGRGYQPGIDKLLPAIDGVESFLAVEHFDDKLFHKSVFHYAFIADRNFTIPAVKIAAYNPYLQREYQLETPKIPIVVKESETNEGTTTPLLQNLSWQTFKHYIDALLAFISALLVCAILIFLRKRYAKRLTPEERFLYRIQHAKTSKDILQHLLAYDRDFFAPEIASLEMRIYSTGGPRKVSMKRLKKEIEQKLFHRDIEKLDF